MKEDCLTSSEKLNFAYRLIWEEMGTLPEPLRNELFIILARLDCLLKRLDRVPMLVDSQG